jgi:hypothetical protein
MLAAHGDASEHPPAQIVPPHAFGAQSTVSAFGHMPLPSHVAASVAIPAVQAAVRQDCAVPGYVHVSRLAPSHVPAQGVPAPAHALCDGRGVPVTATHCPEILIFAIAKSANAPPLGSLRDWALRLPGRTGRPGSHASDDGYYLAGACGLDLRNHHVFGVTWLESVSSMRFHQGRAVISAAESARR